MNSGARIGTLLLGLIFSGSLLGQAVGQEQPRPDQVVNSDKGKRLESVRVSLRDAGDLVTQLLIPNQGEFVEKGVSAISYYSREIHATERSLSGLVTMEEMAALIPDGQQKETVMYRVADAYQTVRLDLVSLRLAAREFEEAGKLKEDEDLRKAVEKLRTVETAFLAVYAEREALIKDHEQRQMRSIKNAFDDVLRDIKGEAKRNP